MRKRARTKGILLAILLLWIGMFTTDSILAGQNHRPLFCIETQENAVYTGILYKVLWRQWVDDSCAEGELEVEPGRCAQEEWELVTWFVTPNE